MSIQTVREYLAPLGLAERILEFETSSATVELAARAAGVIPARIAKSLSLMLPEGPILLVTAGDTRIDNPRFKPNASATPWAAYAPSPSMKACAPSWTCP